MPALEIDPAALPPDERKEIEQLLAGPKILAEPEGASSVGWFLLAALGAAGLSLLLFWKGLGVVTSPWASQGLWIAIPYALATATLAIGIFKVAAALGMQRLPWKPGRYLLAQGFLDTRRRPLRFRPIAGFTRLEIHEGETHTTELRLFTMSVHFGDEVENFHLFGLPDNIPRAALDELSSHRDAALDAQRSEGGYRFSRRADAGAPGPQPRARLRLSEHPWKAAGIVGVLAIVPIYFVLLPLLSVRAAEENGSVGALRAAATAYPRGWIAARVRPAIHARFDAARAAVGTGIAAEHRAPMERLLTYLEAQDRSVVRVRLVLPDSERLDAATRTLEALIKDTPGATAAPVVLNYQVASLAGFRVGQDELTRALAARLKKVIPEAVLDLESEPNRFDGPPVDPGDPVIEIACTIEPVSVFQGEGGSRMFAALAFGYAASLLLPDEPRVQLVATILVPPPSNLSVSRITMGSEKLQPLGSSGNALFDRMDDSTVYIKQAEIAAQAGGPMLAKALLAP